MLFPDEPNAGGWAVDGICDHFLRWAEERGSSDVVFNPTDPVAIRTHGQWWFVTRRPPSITEIAAMLDNLARDPAASSRVRGGAPLDFSHEVDRSPGDRRGGRIRFRGNATACAAGWAHGVSVTLRLIHGIPPALSDLDLEPALVDALFPPNGLVSVSGVMGSGKSTLIVAGIRHIRETQRRRVITYEEPIEFDLTRIDNPMGPLEQSAVPSHLPDFSSAVANASRRAADVILLGETRDAPTMRALVSYAETGATVYHTIHTSTVAQILSRALGFFVAEERPAIGSSLLSSLRLLVQQRLYRRADSEGRIAVREFLALDQSMRERLLATPQEHITQEIDRMVKRHGQPLIEAAGCLHADGILSDRDFQDIEREFRKEPLP